MKKKVLSIIVPCFNEEESLPLFYKEIKNVEELFNKKDIVFEYIFVDDGSIDNTLNIIKQIKENNIHYISFSKNFGKEAAMYAGLKKASGDFVALIDADLQHPPKLLIEMYQKIKDENYDVVINQNRKGEAIWETSMSGGKNAAWNNDAFCLVYYDHPFMIRGGGNGSEYGSGMFAFTIATGEPIVSNGFRAVIIVNN